MATFILEHLSIRLCDLTSKFLFVVRFLFTFETICDLTQPYSVCRPPYFLLIQIWIKSLNSVFELFTHIFVLDRHLCNRAEFHRLTLLLKFWLIPVYIWNLSFKLSSHLYLVPRARPNKLLIFKSHFPIGQRHLILSVTSVCQIVDFLLFLSFFILHRQFNFLVILGSPSDWLDLFLPPFRVPEFFFKLIEVLC